MQEQPSNLETVTHTTCPYCGVGCGIVVTTNTEQICVRGDVDHPANRGKLCVKGTSVGETLSTVGRLLQPMVYGKPVSPLQAIQTVADGFANMIAQYGPDSVAFYVSGQLLTEDYYVANKLIKGFIGTANIDTNSRLCMASAVVGYKRAFGSDTVPACYEDLAEADLLVLVGSNTAWAHPILFQQMAQSKRDKAHQRIITIDPRVTATNDIADLHLPLKAGTDAFLFNGLLTYLAENGALNHDYIAQFTQGLDDALLQAKTSAPSVVAVAQMCGLSVEAVTQFYTWFAQTPKTVTFYSQGVNQSTSGADKSNAIINVHLATGRVGQVGASPFSITGQPNAMGGREVGGLANQLAAHMDFNCAEAVDRVARFWQAPKMATQHGLKAVDLFKAVHDGTIKAVWIMHTNPVVSMPDADFVRAALERCPLVVVSDNMANTDTVKLAHIQLPAASWGEKDGTVTNSDRTISRQRAFLPMAGQAKPDWWWISRVAQAMGFVDAFSYETPADIFREHAALSGFENDGVQSRRDFDISLLSTLSNANYDVFAPMPWPITAASPHGIKRLLSDGQFFTANRKANFVAITPQLAIEQPSSDYPFILNTGRYRDQWHSMTRTAMTPRLLQHRREPLLAMHPKDAHDLGIQSGDLVTVRSRLATNLLRVEYDAGLQQGNVFVPIHWSGIYASAARVDALIPAHVDRLSGQPESKHAVVSITPFSALWQGWLLTRDDWQPNTAYWVKVPLGKITLWWLADNQSPSMFDFTGELLRYTDCGEGVMRWAMIENDRLQAVFCMAPFADDRLPSPDGVAHLFSEEKITDSQRLAILSGKDACVEDVGPMVCACFQVGQKTLELMMAGGANTVEAIGSCCLAGTNCGSCLPEIKALLAKQV